MAVRMGLELEVQQVVRTSLAPTGTWNLSEMTVHSGRSASVSKPRPKEMAVAKRFAKRVPPRQAHSFTCISPILSKSLLRA